MSILVKGMEMPTEGEAVVLVISNENGKTLADVDEYCGAVYEAAPVPPHGRLIDADAFLALINDCTILPDFLKRIINPLIQGEPTVIEAEEGET